MIKFQVKSTDPNGEPVTLHALEMPAALKSARQLRSVGYFNIVMHDVESGIETPIDEFDELD